MFGKATAETRAHGKAGHPTAGLQHAERIVGRRQRETAEAGRRIQVRNQASTAFRSATCRDLPPTRPRPRSGRHADRQRARRALLPIARSCRRAVRQCAHATPPAEPASSGGCGRSPHVCGARKLGRVAARTEPDDPPCGFSVGLRAGRPQEQAIGEFRPRVHESGADQQQQVGPRRASFGVVSIIPPVRMTSTSRRTTSEFI